jgi:cystathionine gamma-synthase
MTHAAMDPDARTVAGIGDALLRISVGLEDAADLKKALKAAFRAIASVSKKKPCEGTRSPRAPHSFFRRAAAIIHHAA